MGSIARVSAPVRDFSLLRNVETKIETPPPSLGIRGYNKLFSCEKAAGALSSPLPSIQRPPPPNSFNVVHKIDIPQKKTSMGAPFRNVMWGDSGRSLAKLVRCTWRSGLHCNISRLIYNTKCLVFYCTSAVTLLVSLYKIHQYFKYRVFRKPSFKALLSHIVWSHDGKESDLRPGNTRFEYLQVKSLIWKWWQLVSSGAWRRVVWKYLLWCAASHHGRLHQSETSLWKRHISRNFSFQNFQDGTPKSTAVHLVHIIRTARCVWS